MEKDAPRKNTLQVKAGKSKQGRQRGFARWADGFLSGYGRRLAWSIFRRAAENHTRAGRAPRKVAIRGRNLMRLPCGKAAGFCDALKCDTGFPACD